MKPQQFQDLLNAVPLLSSQQRNTLINALSEQNSPSDIAKSIEDSFVRAPKCPHCGSEALQRWGKRNKRQRFRCKVCRKTLNAFSKTPLARLRRPEAWPKYLEGMTHSLTLRPAAKQCGVSLNTSFRWRHRFLQVIEHDQAPELSGIAELDETFFRESFKGQKKGLPRPVRKRGSDKKTDCRKIPVMVARDRGSQTVDGVLKNESADELCRHLNGRINIETVVCADASLAHEKLARALGFTFKELVSSSGIRVIEGVFHLQHVNAYHSHLKQWITGIFHGVATKYLSHYLGWRRALTGINALTSDRLANKILEFLHFNP
ncbi:IS1595 family transposase [Endozoicomonas sp. GU-1]|uniref:IS1595 family transposase n=1 Tax=Endozoicomonas sp. GU-1 TaxID=3009078 RepID=UPI0022B3F87E|nr:IS1595 family transposase [Endozoicomonas sp. GU-1]WBA81416.1 IS1595 family transposase [Endozoicomonas sp. GU-1]WBA84364.1 IS1595 family transposase [Endozoicomonas sp. GU-1]